MQMEHLSVELERHHQACYGWALCCCDGDRERAEDVLQTVYLKILQGKARFEGRSSLRTWLFAVVFNTARSQARRWLRRLNLNSGLAAFQSGNGVPANAEELVAEDQLRQRLEKILSRLPKRQRQVLHLVFYQDMTVNEAARIMRVRPGSARVHYHRGKNRLRRLIEEEGLKDELH